MRYPICRVVDEAAMIVERRNVELASLGVIIQAATMTTGMGTSREAVTRFNKLIEDLSKQ